MKTIKTKVYYLDELSDSAKEKAREWYRNGITEYQWLEEYLTEVAEKELSSAGIAINNGDISVYYSLSYCQGDGAMVELRGHWKGWEVRVKHSGYYYHYNSKEIEIWKDTDSGTEHPDEKTEGEFNEIYVSVCKTLEKLGYTYIESENSDENIDENIRANEYTFTETGVRFG